MTNVRFPLLSSKFQNVPATSFVFLSLNFTVFRTRIDFLREKNLFTASRIRQKLQICFNRFTEPFSL